MSQEVWVKVDVQNLRFGASTTWDGGATIWDDGSTIWDTEEIPIQDWEKLNET